MFQQYNLDINMHHEQDNISEGEPSRNITAISEANGGNLLITLMNHLICINLFLHLKMMNVLKK